MHARRERDFGTGYGSSSGYAVHASVVHARLASGRLQVRLIVAPAWADLAPSRDSVFRPGDHLPGLNAMSRGTAMEPLGIVFTEIGPDFLRATMPVDARTEAALWPAARLVRRCCSPRPSAARPACSACAKARAASGIEINANHLRGVRDGLVTGTARPLHVGRQTQGVGKSASKTIAASWSGSRA
jgi:acyl-coenzyme A thioesterase PaaI-like protein